MSAVEIGGSETNVGELIFPGQLSLGETLELPVVRGGLPQMLVGGDSLSRTVRWTHVIDLPDPRRLLRGGELVLTTGYGMPPTTAGRREWVERIAEQDAAALAVEIGVAFPVELPPGIVEGCQATGLPLLVFRRRVAFVELTRVINSTIAARGGVIAGFVSAMQSELISMLAKESTVGEMLDMVADRLRIPLVLESASRDIIHCAFGGIPEHEVFRALADLHRYEKNGTGGLALVASLPRGEGRVIALELETPLGPEHRALLAAAAQMFSLDLLRGGVLELNAVSKAQFLDDLAAARIPPRLAEERAALLGFMPTRPTMAVVARYRDVQEGREPETWTELAAPLRMRIEKLGFRCLIGASSEELAGLIEVGPEKGQLPAAVVDAVRGLCVERGLEPTSVALVFGRECRGWREAGRQLAGAVRRARVAQLLAWRDWYDAGEPDLSDLLYEVRELPALRRFVAECLGPLAEGDHRSAVALETLTALAANGGNKAGTAKALHLDRGALYQRIKRIEELLSCDLGDPRTLMSVHLALEARALLRQYPADSA